MSYSEEEAQGLANEIKKLRQEVARLRELKYACISLRTDIEGTLPVRGWLKDNNRSRAALGRITAILDEEATK